MDKDIHHQIAKLPDRSTRELQELWLELYERAAPQGMRRSLLVPFLAYRIQELAYGGLKLSTRAELRRIARELEKAKGPTSTSAVPRRQIKPGTRIIRHWKGKPHEVSVTESGFEYGGTNYRSLSHIARKITGTRWSGPAFFGLNKADPPARDQSHE